MSFIPKAILFDLDGTLLDTAPEFCYCLNLLLEANGKPLIEVDQLRSVVSFGSKGMIEFAFKITDADPEFEEIKQQFLGLYRSDLGLRTHFFPGIVEILNLMTELQIKWGIVTNKSDLYTHPLIEKFHPLSQAQCIVSGNTLLTPKPDPAPLLLACQRLAVSPNECWYVGDSLVDVQASKAAKIACAIVTYGYIPKNVDPRLWAAECYLISPREIAKLINPAA